MKTFTGLSEIIVNKAGRCAIAAVIYDKAGHYKGDKTVIAQPSLPLWHFVKSHCKTFALQSEMTEKVHSNQQCQTGGVKGHICINQQRCGVKAVFYTVV